VSDTVVDLAVVSGGSAVASMPASITVPAGSASGTWTVVTAPVASTTAVQISATANGGSKTGTLTVKPATPSSLTFTPNVVTGGGTSSGKVSFSQPIAVDTPITIAIVTGSQAISSFRATVIIPAGTTNITFTVSTAPVAQSTAVQFSATANGGTVNGTLTVK
jgi:hypothetical protein